MRPKCTSLLLRLRFATLFAARRPRAGVDARGMGALAPALRRSFRLALPARKGERRYVLESYRKVRDLDRGRLPQGRPERGPRLQHV